MRPKVDSHLIPCPIPDDLPVAYFPMVDLPEEQIEAHLRQLRRDAPAWPRGDFKAIEALEFRIGGFTRIDLWDRPIADTPQLWFYFANWTPHDRATLSRPAGDGWTRPRILNYLRLDDWIVRTWPGGARAWRFAVRPVRSRSAAGNLYERQRQRRDPKILPVLPWLDLTLDM
jgi:hypothetical protein